DVDEALKEVRLALLEADVNFRVAKDLTGRVHDRTVGTPALESINPGQQVVKVVHEELTSVLSAGDHKLLPAPQAPTLVMLIGLQGSGKTTTAAKLALHLRRASGQRSLLVAADLRRPAAVEQLETLGRQSDIPVYSEGIGSTPLKVAHNGVQRAKELGVLWVILDTGGRLHIDDELMEELVAMKQSLSPHEVLLVVDSMTGQDAVRAAGAFHQRVGLTGLILTKLDGDARGGAALSITSVTSVPIKFIGAGEKADALEPFYPERLASRILGMGDVLSLVEKAQAAIDQKQAEEMERKLRRATFNFQDFLDQLRAVKRMGSLSQLLELLPGFSGLQKRLPLEQLDEQRLKRIEAIVLSMTPEERQRPEILSSSRKRRIAKGSGTSIQDVNQLLNQFFEMQKIMKRLSRTKGGGLLGALRL
ncbi:MAG: signal recognition particle protein, partial [Chloroflexi bacterium]|nr:signal recognition particle protein [Chloroflexota bacterium]